MPYPPFFIKTYPENTGNTVLRNYLQRFSREMLSARVIPNKVEEHWRTMQLMFQDSERKRIGSLGEGIACEFLQGKGFSIYERNYRKPWGEIDIVAEKGGIVRFVEVKTVSREALEGISREMEYRPEEMVDVRKLTKLARTATLYMETTHDKREYQIDVVGVILVERLKTARCRLFEQVLEDNL